MLHLDSVAMRNPKHRAQAFDEAKVRIVSRLQSWLAERDQAANAAVKIKGSVAEALVQSFLGARMLLTQTGGQNGLHPSTIASGRIRSRSVSFFLHHRPDVKETLATHYNDTPGEAIRRGGW
jgi:hypothetical protein